jgi:hypothetical protein
MKHNYLFIYLFINELIISNPNLLSKNNKSYNSNNQTPNDSH